MNLGLIKSGKFGRRKAEARAALQENSERQQTTMRKKRRLKYIAVLPSFITLMNGACGFFSIVIASRSPMLRWSLPFIRRSSMTSFALAGYLILLAMIMDMLDGRVARLTRTTSSFGGQLDSLSDAVSFGIGPAFLMLKLVEYHLEHLSLQSLNLSILLGRGIFFSAIIYAMCALVRLARFNVENEEDESAHMNFSGLPSPAAAGVVVSLVILQQQFFPGGAEETPVLPHILESVTVFTLPVITLSSGILMVSRIRYPHVTNQLLRSKKSPVGLLALFASCLLVVWNIQFALAAGFCGFALFGIFRWLIMNTVKKRKLRARPEREPPSPGTPS